MNAKTFTCPACENFKTASALSCAQHYRTCTGPLQPASDDGMLRDLVDAERVLFDLVDECTAVREDDPNPNTALAAMFPNLERFDPECSSCKDGGIVDDQFCNCPKGQALAGAGPRSLVRQVAEEKRLHAVTEAALRQRGEWLTKERMLSAELEKKLNELSDRHVAAVARVGLLERALAELNTALAAKGDLQRIQEEAMREVAEVMTRLQSDMTTMQAQLAAQDDQLTDKDHELFQWREDFCNLSKDYKRVARQVRVLKRALKEVL